MCDRPSATIVIPQHGRTELTRRCVQSIRATDRIAWPIRIVDDGSPPDDSPCELARRFSDVVVHRQPHHGVTAAWNTASSRVTSPFLVFLNNDVIAHGKFVERLIAPLITGPAWMTGVAMRTERHLPTVLLHRLPTRRFLPGWCFAMRASLLRDLDGFDERLRLYWSDTDLQLRLVQHADAIGDVLHAVDNLPLHHLAHQTAHALPHCKQQWNDDRAAFVQKWARHLATR